MASPPPSPRGHDPSHPECLTILGLLPPVTAEDVKQAYLAKAMAAHPDRGGDPAEFVRLQKAYEDAKEFVQFKAGKLEWLAAKIEAYAQQQEVVTEAIVTVRVRGPRADDVFAILLGFRADSLKDLATLDLAGGTLTDEGLLQLKELKNLRALDLRGTAVGKLAADVPKWFEHLEFLGLPKGAVGMLGRFGMPRRVKLVVGDAPTA